MGYLRYAVKEDAELLFHWANESTVRKNAFSSAPISHEEHIKWFDNMLMRRDAKQYIYMCDEQPAGQIRIAVSGDTAEISYSICLEKRCMGYAKEMVTLLQRQVQKDFPEIKKLTARVKPDNIASQKVFLDTGYTHKCSVYEIETDACGRMPEISNADVGGIIVNE